VACGIEQYGIRYNTAGTRVAAGTQNDIYVRNGTLNSTCGQGFNDERHSTAHLAGPNGGWAEAGWDEIWGPNNTHEWWSFWEWSDGGGGYTGGFNSGPAIACCGWYRYEAEYLSSAGGWEFFVDPGADGGFIQMGSVGHPGFTLGEARGGTGRRPDATTGLNDHMRNLKYETCGTCSYIAWTDNATRANLPTGWYYSRISNTEFAVCSTSNGCPNP
jgi:hypothetical protein